MSGLDAINVARARQQIAAAEESRLGADTLPVRMQRSPGNEASFPWRPRFENRLYDDNRAVSRTLPDIPWLRVYWCRTDSLGRGSSG